jgi:Tfp pilus tip-associated adhesin PilY1
MNAIKPYWISLLFIVVIVNFVSTAFGAGNIYTAPAVTLDSNYNLLLIWGTGDKTKPLAKDGVDRIFVVKDTDREKTYTLSDLKDITNSTYTDTSDGHGWYISLNEAVGEKVLGDVKIADKKIFATSYIPASGTDACSKAGKSRLYILNIQTGEGAYEDGTRYKEYDKGMSTTVSISDNMDTGKKDVFMPFSEELDDKSHTKRITDPFTSGGMQDKNLIYWRDMRIQ